MNIYKKIGNAFNGSAKHYDDVSGVQYEIGSRLLQRLAYFKIQPKSILDLGCGPGSFTSELKMLYPKSQVVGLDLAVEMLKIAKKKQRWTRKAAFINADMNRLPFADEQFDLIFSNQVIHWSQSIESVIKELYRVLAKNGCLIFSTLGPDTFLELKKAFSAVDSYSHVNNFLDMHDIGDSLLRENFLDPVMDMEMLTVHYAELKDLLYGLKAQGVININFNRNKGLTGRKSWSKFIDKMSDSRLENGKYPLSYEVLNGHAWKGAQKTQTCGIESSFSVDALKATIKK